MKADLPTEEDVLAMLVLFGAKPLLTNACSTEQLDERDAWNAAVAELNRVPNPPSAIAYQRVRNAGSIEAAIADSERRLEVERAQTEVIRAAYFLAAAPGDSQARLRESVYRMNCARREAGMETLP